MTDVSHLTRHPANDDTPVHKRIIYHQRAHLRRLLFVHLFWQITLRPMSDKSVIGRRGYPPGRDLLSRTRG